MTESGVSIIIPIFNGIQHLERLLATFFKINTYQPFEFIIIDHSSTGGAAQVVSEYITRAFIRLINPSHNQSFSAACNLGASKARYPHLLFLDAGIAYTSDVLPTALAKLADPAIGIVRVCLKDDPESLPPGQTPQVWHAGIHFVWNDQRQYFQPEPIRHTTLTQAEPIPKSGIFPAVTRAFLLCRKADFQVLGGFNEDYDAELEDIDFCLRMRSRLKSDCWCINEMSLGYLDSVTHRLGDRNDRDGRCQKIEQDHQIFKERWNNYLRALIGQLPADLGAPARRARLGKHLNILFVLYETIDSNGGLHVQLHAARLMVSGADCLFAVPKAGGQGPNPKEADSRVRTFAQVEKDGLTFSDGRGPDIIHAWTPREVVRKFVESIGIKYPCPLVIHLEDNEEYLAEVTVGRPFAELVRLPEQELDPLIPAGRYHPVRGRKFLEQARGLTLIISTLGRFNTANVPSIVLPPPVDERLFYPRPLNRILREELGIPEDHVVLVYTGNVHAGNREEVRELYRAVRQLNEQGCPATLIRTGINAVNLGSEIWITAHEKPLGWVERNRMPEILAAADFFVQPGAPGPFNDERVPSKLPEYFAMGRPVILPRTNLGLKVEHGRQAWVLDVADAESIAEAVRRLTADRVLRQRLAVGAAAFHRVQSNPSQVAEALLDLYGVESSTLGPHSDEAVMSS